MITPLTESKPLQTALGLSVPLYLKREDLHPLDSHKGRSIPVMIAHYLKTGATDFVISSSGNAAIAAAKTVATYNAENDKKISLIIFIGEKVDDQKKKILLGLTDKQITVTQTPNPKQLAIVATNEGKTILRQSTDDTALTGYEELAQELITELPNLAAVFIPTSSGTTAQGLFNAFEKGNKKVTINIVQTDAVHPFVAGPNSVTPSVANAIVDKVGHRAAKIKSVLTESGGAGYIATNEDIAAALELAKKNLDFELSPNSALSLAGLMQAVKNKTTFSGPVVLLVTGN